MNDHPAPSPSPSERLEAVRAELAAALERAGRPAGNCALLAVSKRFPPDQIQPVADAGQRLFGESRVQEAVEKIPAMPGGLEWHFIGHLQKNKIRKILPLVTTLHSIDSVELAQAVDRIAGECGTRPEIYLEVNVAGDRAKFGFAPADVAAAVDRIAPLPHVDVVGLMTIPPIDPDPGSTRRHFAALRELRDSLEQSTGTPLPGLSMGMSGDFAVAAEEGSTIVRVGTALFGQRPAP